MSLGIFEEKTSADGHEARGAAGTVCKLVPHPPRARITRPMLDPPRVLVADDYEDAAESLVLLLECTGARTEVALDGRRALAIASHWRPEICVLDLQMPELDGCEVARQIRSQSWEERPLLVALTGWTTENDRMRALDAGFDYYVTKPVEPSWLLRLIKSYCRVI